MNESDKARIIRLIGKYGDMRSMATAHNAEASKLYEKGLLDGAEMSTATAKKQDELAAVTLQWIIDHL